MTKKHILMAALALILVSSPALAEKVGDHGKGGGRLEQMDTNGDDKISKDEFTKKCESRFSKMDIDGDGYLTKADREAHHESMTDEEKAAHKERREEMKAKREARKAAEE